MDGFSSCLSVLIVLFVGIALVIAVAVFLFVMKVVWLLLPLIGVILLIALICRLDSKTINKN